MPSLCRSRPASQFTPSMFGRCPDGPEHAKNVFHTIDFQTQIALHLNRNSPAINLTRSPDHTTRSRPILRSVLLNPWNALEHLERTSDDSFALQASPVLPPRSARLKERVLFGGGAPQRSYRYNSLPGRLPLVCSRSIDIGVRQPSSRSW